MFFLYIAWVNVPSPFHSHPFSSFISHYFLQLLFGFIANLTILLGTGFVVVEAVALVSVIPLYLFMVLQHLSIIFINYIRNKEMFGRKTLMACISSLFVLGFSSQRWITDNLGATEQSVSIFFAYKYNHQLFFTCYPS